MPRVEYQVTLLTKITQIILCLLLAAGGVWITRGHSSLVDRSIGVTPVIACTVCCILLLFRLPKRVVRLTLDDVGIRDTSLGTLLIPWKDIVAAKTVFFFGSMFIGVLPVDESDRISRMSWIRRFGVFSNRCFGLPAFCINPNGLNVPSTEICDELRSRLENFGFVQSDRE